MSDKIVPYLIYCNLLKKEDFSSIEEAITSNFISKRISANAVAIISDNHDAKEIYDTIMKDLDEIDINDTDILVLKWGESYGHIPNSAWEWVKKNSPDLDDYDE